VTVSLKNTSGRLQVFVLAHETYCAARGECACEVTKGRGSRRIPHSLTLATGVTSGGLHDAVLAVPEVRRAIQRGELRAARDVLAQPRTPGEPDSPVAAVAAVATESPSTPQPKKKRGSR
jgi:hypothetical protein